jgi:hypothetical protein
METNLPQIDTDSPYATCHSGFMYPPNTWVGLTNKQSNDLLRAPHFKVHDKGNSPPESSESFGQESPLSTNFHAQFVAINVSFTGGINDW